LTGPAGFDSYADSYDEALASGISVSGEGRDYFAEGRVAFLAHCLEDLGIEPRRVMDFGCGTGKTARHLLARFPTAPIVGIDVSNESIACANRLHGSDRAVFQVFDGAAPPDPVDLVYTNGVFHHIPVADRSDALRYVHRALRPRGLLALWENNPWNPGTRYVMSRIPFDRDAIMLSARKARGLLRQSGFEVLRTDFLFIFPRALRWLRSLERPLSSWPLGAQYQVLCRRVAPVPRSDRSERAAAANVASTDQ
jgi:SAM-dependent methyltransferase